VYDGRLQNHDICAVEGRVIFCGIESLGLARAALLGRYLTVEINGIFTPSLLDLANFNCHL
jgi:hypothetical protein